MKKTFYRIGEHFTERPWDRPTREAVEVWWNSFKDTKYLDQFKIWIGGGVLEETTTWDLDIIITGQFKYPADLKHVLDEGIRIGLKHWMLVDIKWKDNLWEDEFQPFKQIRSFNEIEKSTPEKHIIKKYKGVEIYPGLFQHEYKKPTKTYKFSKKMIDEGKYTFGLQKFSDYIYNNKPILT